VGADAFHVGYGVRREVEAADAATVEALELRRHPWQVAAKQHRLRVWWGVTTDERRFFVLIGHVVGHFGWEGEAAGQLSDAEAAAVASETAERLQAAGIEGQAAWHFQFEPDR
jgi:hypothetical protein